jgi:hypothetical protein
MSRVAYPALSVYVVTVPYRTATIQYIYVLCCCHTVPALPSQNVEHVGTKTIIILTVQYVSDGALLQLLQDSDQGSNHFQSFQMALLSCLRGKAANTPPEYEGTYEYDRVIYLATR